MKGMRVSERHPKLLKGSAASQGSKQLNNHQTRHDFGPAFDWWLVCFRGGFVFSLFYGLEASPHVAAPFHSAVLLWASLSSSLFSPLSFFLSFVEEKKGKSSSRRKRERREMALNLAPSKTTQTHLSIRSSRL